jgi:hypothetical protein
MTRVTYNTEETIQKGTEKGKPRISKAFGLAKAKANEKPNKNLRPT